MATRRIGLIFLLAALVGGGLTSLAHGSPRCRGCNILDEGYLNQSLVGHIVYERGSRGFQPVRVERVDTNPPAIYWRNMTTGDGAWNDARSYYSEGAYRELVADGRGGASSSYMAPIDREARNRLWAICYSYIAARDRAETLGDAAMLWMMQRGCCQSTDARRFGTPPRAC
jgi:hypothetical protein